MDTNSYESKLLERENYKKLEAVSKVLSYQVPVLSKLIISDQSLVELDLKRLGAATVAFLR